MFVLRKFNGKGLESNQSLGDSYHIVYRETQYEEFCRSFKAWCGKDHVADGDTEATDITKRCYALIIHMEGRKIIPLYKTQENYIMTENGRTFANVTYGGKNSN